jgi:uncharacterized protein YcbX
MHKRILSQIWIYPVKSLGGIRLKSANVMDKGLQYDRRWMLVDEEGVFMTQRLNPKMALFKVLIDQPKGKLNFTFEQDHFSMPTHSPISSKFIGKVWEDAVEVIEVSEECSQWFSEKLKVKCRLVSFPEQNPRPVDPLYKVNDEHVSLADGYPFLIIGEQSLADLNGKLQEPVPMNRFRPNFVFTGGTPYEEDTWKDFRIGRNRFVGVKPCGRCIMTTINQETAEQGKEPLATLSTYRKQNNKIYFGQNVLAIDHNEIQEGDEISF